MMYYYFHARTYELKVHGGTPFESGVELDATNIKGMELATTIIIDHNNYMYINHPNIHVLYYKMSCDVLTLYSDVLIL